MPQKNLQELISCVFYPEVREHQQTIFHRASTCQAVNCGWAFQIGVFMTEQVGRPQLSENVQRHISAINQRELENRRVKRLGEWTTNQDNEGTQM